MCIDINVQKYAMCSISIHRCHIYIYIYNRERDYFILALSQPGCEHRKSASCECDFRCLWYLAATVVCVIAFVYGL